MPVTVRVPPPWRKYTDQQRDVTAEGPTVGEALRHLAAQYPALAGRLYDRDGRVTSAVAVFLNQDSIHRLGGLETPVSDGDRVILLMAIAGG